MVLCPLTFMNRSGDALLWLDPDRSWSPERILLVYDDVDLPLGDLRLRPRGSSGGHRGAQSVITALQTQEFPRLRLGVGAAPPGVETADHVLARPSEEESLMLQKSVADAVTAVIVWLDCASIENAMTQVNGRPPPSTNQNPAS